VACRIGRANAWAASDFAGEFAGSDPLNGIANAIGAYWARDHQNTLIAILGGLFGSGGTLVATNELDISEEDGAAAVIGASAILDATQLMGDAKNNLSGIMMHSAVENALRKNDLISDVQKESTLGQAFPMYMGKRVIVDDGCPYDTDTGAATTYIFGDGAFAYADCPTKTEFETERKAATSIDAYYSRKNFYLHPQGCKWNGADMVGDTPTDVELATVSNWTKVWATKDVRIVALKALVAAAA
jgi:hypothetical protein